MNIYPIDALSSSSPSTTGTQKAEMPSEDFQTILQKTLDKEQDKVNSTENAYLTPFMVNGLPVACLNAQEATGGSSESSVQGVQQSNRITIDGITVITSGHTLDNREGVSLLETLSETGSNNIFSRFTSFAEANDSDESENSDAMVAMEGAPMMTVVESKALGPLPEGATSSYMNIDLFRPAGKWAEDPMSIPTNSGANDSFYKRRTEELMRVVGVERQLKELYGNDIKLIYSHLDENYIMLTPDDARYNEMNSAESSVQTIQQSAQGIH